MIPLKRKTTSEHAEDVAFLLKTLEAKGYTASSGDVEAAYTAWSKALPHKPAWHPLSFLKGKPDDLFKALMSQLEPQDDHENPAPQDPPGAPAANRADSGPAPFQEPQR